MRSECRSRHRIRKCRYILIRQLWLGTRSPIRSTSCKYSKRSSFKSSGNSHYGCERKIILEKNVPLLGRLIPRSLHGCRSRLQRVLFGNTYLGPKLNYSSCTKCFCRDFWNLSKTLSFHLRGVHWLGSRYRFTFDWNFCDHWLI